MAALSVLAGSSGAAAGGRGLTDCQLPEGTQTLLLNPIFTDRLATIPLMYPKIETLGDLADQLDALYFPTSAFKDAYRNLTPISYSRGCLDTLDCVYEIVTVGYAVGSLLYSSRAYYKEADIDPGTYAAVVIPGSGQNQSTPIYRRSPDNYQYDIAGIVGTYWDLYVCVKPNEDFLAINNGSAKLDYEYIVGHLANRGGSYSCRYIADTMAMVKYLRAAYSKVVVIGLSQGGLAALYNALQSEPDGAIIASGFSILNETLQGASLAQIIIPGMREYLSNDRIRDKLRESHTDYLFTWGLDERGVYGVEAWYGCTRSFLAGISNVTSYSHGGGHEFPPEAVSFFLENLRRRSQNSAGGDYLSQNAPNPFGTSTRISFRVETEGHVSLAIFDAKGRLVRTLVSRVLTPDVYTQEWDGVSDDGRLLPSGTYFYHLITSDSKEVRKMTLAR